MLIAIAASKSKTQYFINQAYVDYVKEAGFDPLLVTTANDISTMAEVCDGLLLPGGIDIDPIYYGEDNYSSNASEPEKDAFERDLLYGFIKNNKPVFGICRGMQLIARELLAISKIFAETVEYEQHIHHHSLADALNVSRTQPTHSVGMLERILYDDMTAEKSTVKHFVNSMHHQGLVFEVATPKGPISLSYPLENNMAVSLAAITSYGVEARKNTRKFVVEAIDIRGWSTAGVRGVQWHPEELKDYKLIQAFFNANVEHKTIAA